MPGGAELSRHDPDVPDWDAWPPESRRLFSRMMEVVAGFLDHTYRPNTQSIPYFATPYVLNRPRFITATVEIPPGGADGVLLCQGTAAGSYSFYLEDGHLHHVHNYVGRELHTVTSPDVVPEGGLSLRFEFEPTGRPDRPRGRGAPGRLELYIDGELVADALAPVTTPVVLDPGALSCSALAVDARCAK